MLPRGCGHGSLWLLLWCPNLPSHRDASRVAWLGPWWETWPLNSPRSFPLPLPARRCLPGTGWGRGRTPFLSANAKEAVQHIRTKDAVSWKIKILTVNPLSCQTCKVGPTSGQPRDQNDSVKPSPSGAACTASAAARGPDDRIEYNTGDKTADRVPLCLPCGLRQWLDLRRRGWQK